MTRLLLVGTLALMAGAASAQTPAARQSDLAPAAPTATKPPDAANTYEYPPNTGKILQPANRTPYDSPSSGADANTRPVAGSTSPTTTAR